MIPLSAREHVEYLDNDGVVFLFKPKTGANEGELFTMFAEGETLAKSIEKLSAFIDKILVGWRDTKKAGMPAFPAEGRVSDMFNQNEKLKLLDFWTKANALTPEEKKL